MKAMREQVDEQPKIIKLFSINYARDLLYDEIIINKLLCCMIRKSVKKKIYVL
jgi:hypothetical protein